MRMESWVGTVVALLVCGVLASAARAQQCDPRPLPQNIALPPHLGVVLRRLYDHSPTFRSQCERLERASNLRVVIRLSTTLPARCRALTIVRRRGHAIVADIQLTPGAALVELVGHEFEHLLEQVEGLNLRRLARLEGSGVWEVERQLFETDRAITAGRLIADESRSSMRAD